MKRWIERPSRVRNMLPHVLVALLAASTALLAPAEAQQPRRAARATPGPAPRAYVTNPYAGTVSVINTMSRSVEASRPVGASPGRPTISADRARVYVPNSGSDSVSVISSASNTVIATIPVNHGPAIAAVSPNGAMVYVGGTDGSIGVIDTALGAMVATFSIGAPSTTAIDNIVFSPDGSRAYALWGSLIVIDTATNSVSNSIYAGNNPTCLAISPDGAHLYVGAQFGYGTFSFYGTVAVVEAATQSVAHVILIWALPMSTRWMVYGSPISSKAIVTLWPLGVGQ